MRSRSIETETVFGKEAHVAFWDASISGRGEKGGSALLFAGSSVLLLALWVFPKHALSTTVPLREKQSS